MENAGVLILAVIAVLAITGLVVYEPAQTDAAAVARPLVGNECADLPCPDGLVPAKLKHYDGYLYCACGEYLRGGEYEKVFEYDLPQGQWLKQ